MKRTHLAVVTALLLAVSLIVPGCVSAETRELSLGTSSAGGNYYLVGSGWGNMISKKSGDINVTSESTTGSTANLTMIQSGELDMGVTLGSTIIESLEGTADWTQGNKCDKIRVLLPLYPSYMTMYALTKNNIKDIYDLNGKSVGTGSLGAGVDSAAKRIFKILDITPSVIHNDSHTNTAPNVGDGVTDVGVSFQNPPYPALVELESSNDVTIIGMTKEAQQKVLAGMPFLFEGTIPANSYKGNKEDVISVADWNWIVCSADMSDEDVYKILDTTFANQSDLLSIHKATANVDMSNYQYASTYLHPGVVKYLKDHNVEVADKLIPPAQ
ncbi:TAXI family TRAP transporter solute-binding subunit [Bacillota bacterium Meth-B3]